MDRRLRDSPEHGAAASPGHAWDASDSSCEQSLQ
jgi:hypothetical protein